MNEFEKLALAEASKSPCSKRKVGAIIVDARNFIVGRGANLRMIDINDLSKGHIDVTICEDEKGNTLSDVKHAEVMAIEDMNAGLKTWQPPLTIYVTHQPCENCLDAIAKAGIETVKIVEAFMKFDTKKLRYDLIPSRWIRGDAEVLTKGAKKYKPNNWRKVPPEEIMRYYAAAMRHLEEWKAYIEGSPDAELFDNGEMGIGTHHLENARVNLGFLLTLTETEEKANAIRDSLRISS